MRRLHQTLLAMGLTAAVGLASATGGFSAQAARPNAANPVIGAHTFDLLTKLGSYHVESTWVATNGKQAAQTVHFSEDVNHKDYHLIATSSQNSNQKSEFIFVHGHFYVGENGQFQDLGSMGQQLAQPILQMTLGFWSGLFLDSGNAHFVGRVTTSGRSANRYSVVLVYAGPNASTGSGKPGLATVHFTNTVDLDVATHAPIRVVGSYTGKDSKGVVSSLKTNFLVSNIGKVGAIRVP